MLRIVKMFKDILTISIETQVLKNSHKSLKINEILRGSFLEIIFVQILSKY